MATGKDEGFSSLDPLGPEYGRINQPLLDSKGLSAFEGDRIEMPKINFPESEKFFPVLPNTGGLDSPQKQVRQQVVGTPPNKPGINKKNFDFNAYKNAYKNNIRAQLQSHQDNNVYAKIYSYDAGPDSNAFYKRYQAYGQEKFDEIGFSPLRDNEALYNSNTTWWDDHKRMMTQSFWPLFGRGFVSGPKSLGKMLTGDFTSSDIEDAEFYKEAAAIGQSSKKGFGAFANNTIMNFGYSAGIMSEAILEEVAGILLAPETAGGSFVVTSANFLKNMGRAFKGLDAAVDGYKAVNTTLKAVDSMNGARNFWQSARNIGKMTLSPIGGTVRAYEAAKIAKATDNISNLAMAYKTAGGFYRDVVRVNMALAEARLEGGMVKNEVYDKLYNQYYARNGEAPSNAEQYEMIKESEKASLNTVLWNAGLIYGSNAITFPNIMGPKGGIKGYLQNSIKEFKTIKGGKFGDIGKVMYNQAKKQFQFEANTFKNMIKSYGSKPLHKAGLGTLGYFKSNFTEGIQENLQEVIAGANEKYYVDTFNSKALSSHEYSKAVAKYNEASQAEYFGKELGKQFTATGFETFASGFAMGALATPVNAVFNNLVVGYNRVFNKEAYEEFKKSKIEATEGLVNQLNNVDIQEFLDSKTFNYATQEGVANVKERGTPKEANDADLEAIVSQMEYLYNKGGTDLFKEKMAHFSEMTPEEFEEAIPTVPKGEGAKYQAKIPDTLKKLDAIEKDYNDINARYPNPVTEENLPPKDSPEYVDAVLLNRSWQKAVHNAVYFKQSFEDTIRRKRDVMAKYVSQAPLKGMSQRDSEVIFDYNKLRNEEVMLRDEVEILKDLKDPESQRQYAFKSRKLAALTKLGEKTANFSNFFNRYEKAGVIKAELQKQRGDVLVTDEEVEAVMDNVFGEFTDENKTRVFSEHSSAYKDYLNALAEVNGGHVFDKDVEESYEMLADHYKLGLEADKLMRYVNLLHDPNAFMEAADRNRKWMKDLYTRRGEIYEKMIKEQLDIVIDNALLNQLANKGIYISLDEFAQWQKDGTPPSEFFDNSLKIIIPEGSLRYEDYYAFFEQASVLKDQRTSSVSETLDSGLRTDLEKADADMQRAIENLPKKEVKVSIKTLKTKNGIKVTLAQIADALEPGQYADGIYDEDAEFPLTVYNDEGAIKLDGPEGEAFKNYKIAFDFIKADIYTLVEQPDPELVKPITEKYEALKNQIREDYASATEVLAEREKAPISDFVPITANVDSISEYPVLYNDLYKSFEEKVLTKISDDEFVNMTEEQQENLFNKFLQTDKNAKIEIDNFNKNQKLQEATKETGEKGEFEYIYQGKKKNTADIKTVTELRRLQRRFKALVKVIDVMEEPTAEDLTDKSRYKVLITDFEKLIATRSRKGLTPELREAMDKAEVLKDKQKDIQVIPEGIIIDGEMYKNAEDVLGQPKSEEEYDQYITEQINDLFGEEGATMFEEARITQEAYDNLFGPKGYLTLLKKRVENGELSIISQDLVVYDPETKVASTIGLLVADTNGNLTIVEVIPDSKSNWDVFKKKDNPKSKLEQTKLLMATKANLLKNTIGVDAKVSVLPIEMSITTTDNKILSANKPSSASLLATDYLINLNTTDVQEQADGVVPVTEKVAEVKPVNVVPADAESSDDVESPAVEAGDQERKVQVIDDAIRYRVSDFKSDLAKVNTKEELQSLLTDLSIKNGEEKVALEDLQEMAKLAREKAEGFDIVETVKIVPESLTKDNQFVAKNTIFTQPGNQKSGVFAEADDTVVIDSINTKNKTVTVSSLGTLTKMTIGFNELNNLFTLKDVVMDATQKSQEPLSSEDKTKINESTDLADAFVKNSNNELDGVEEKASSKSLEDLDEELLEDIEC